MATEWFFQFDAKAWLAGTQLMSASEAGAYINMLAWSWDCGPIPDDDTAICRVSRADLAEARSVLRAKWILSTGGWMNQRLEVERGRVTGRREQAAAAANRRWSPKVIDRSDATAYASAMPTQCDRISDRISDRICGRNANQNQNQNQNQREEESGDESVREEVAEPAPRATKSHAVPPSRLRWTREGGWEGITSDVTDRIVVAHPNVVLSAELARMDLWLRANPSKSGKSNWLRFVTNWLGRSNNQPSVIGGDF